MKEIYEEIILKQGIIITSVLTLTEVIAKPAELKKFTLVRAFINFLANNSIIQLCEISRAISEKAGRLCGKYKFLKA